MTEIEIACTLTKVDLAQRQNELNALRQFVHEICQTPDGFALGFDNSTENLMAIAHIIAQERICCRFLRFQLIAEPDTGSLWLQVSGPGETPKFLLEMFGFNLSINGTT